MKYQVVVLTFLIATALSVCTSPAWNQFNDDLGIACKFCNEKPTAPVTTSDMPGCATCKWKSS